MSRIVSVWLPRWPILRFLAAQAKSDSGTPVDPKRPFVLAVDAAGGPRIAALNAAAEAEGLARGDLLADARAKAEMIQVRAADPAADAAALKRLALWATRYTPAVSPWGEENGADGFFLDVAGAAHLFGGEERLLDDLGGRLGRFGLQARLAVAGTPGAAWALSRYRAAPFIVPPGEEAAALAPLPVEALRLSRETCMTLRRLGFKRIGVLIDKPRAPFAARFPPELLTRIDQALGRVDEPLVPIVPPPVYHTLRYLLEPIFSQEAVVAVATRLMRNLVHALERDGVGARALRLALYRVDGEARTVDIGLTLPTRDIAHVARFLGLKLERVEATAEPGFGFEALGLAVTVAETMNARQEDLTVALEDGDKTERTARLIDNLCQRLGPANVRQFAPVQSHIPERAEALSTATAAAVAWPAADGVKPRPLLLLPKAEPASVTALVPEGPPRSFSWRGITYHVTGAQGPERIAGEWWRDREPQPTRDYYLVEDAAGHRFWLYREGLYARETNEPQWFVHGLFA